SGAADERATREECVAKSQEAAKLIKEIGLEAALKKMNDPNGPFIWKDTYVFAFDSETCKILAHKSPRIVGFMAKDLKDVNGKLYFQEFLHVANTKGEGWVSYMYDKTHGGIPEPKTSYVLKVPGEKVIVGAGIWE
ncbi:MAG: cache domain-containing protein, partial [Syntrophobacteria bacterium]